MKKDTELCQELLSIGVPWTVQRVECDGREKRIDLWLDTLHTSWFGRRKAGTLECGACGRAFAQRAPEQVWQHEPLGEYKVFVHAQLPAERDCHRRPGCALHRPYFGNTNSPISFGLQERVATLARQGLNESEIARWLGLETTTVRAQINARMEAAISEAGLNTDATLPDVPQAQHPGWQRLLQGEMDGQIRTLSLKLLLSRSRAQISDQADETIARSQIETLRRYCAKHPQVLRCELSSLFQ